MERIDSTIVRLSGFTADPIPPKFRSEPDHLISIHGINDAIRFPLRVSYGVFMTYMYNSFSVQRLTDICIE